MLVLRSLLTFFVKPRVHIGEIDTTDLLDLASPLTTLLLANLLLGLESHISDVRKSAKVMAYSMTTEMPLDCALSWRIDTRNVEDSEALVASSREEMATRWVQDQMLLRRFV